MDTSLIFLMIMIFFNCVSVLYLVFGIGTRTVTLGKLVNNLRVDLKNLETNYIYMKEDFKILREKYVLNTYKSNPLTSLGANNKDIIVDSKKKEQLEGVIDFLNKASKIDIKPKKSGLKK